MENSTERNTTYHIHKEMEKFTPEYSIKNIPFLGTEKNVEFIKRMHFYLNPSDQQQEQMLGAKRMKSQKTPPNSKILDPFKDLFKLIQKINFKNTKNGFQARMGRNIKQMKKFAEKSNCTATYLSSQNHPSKTNKTSRTLLKK